MKRLILALLLISSPILVEEDPIYYVHVRPPSSYSGRIGPDGFFHYFTNSAVSTSKEGCDMRIDGACFIKTDFPAKIVKEGIMKTPNMYCCSEGVIKEARKTQTLSSRNYSGYGICTENGRVFEWNAYYLHY